MKAKPKKLGGPAVVIESTPNGVWIRVGKQSRILWTTEVYTLTEYLHQALQKTGKWVLDAR